MDKQEDIRIKLDLGAIPPLRAHPTDAGLDLYSRDNDCVLAAGESRVFDTGVHIGLPSGTCGLIMSRSGLNIKHGIIAAGNGVIDENYTGSIAVKIYNLSQKDYHVAKGERIAQMVIVRCETQPYKIVNTLDETDRGDAGFGSTGKQ